jgi:hypothetical protein
MGVKRDHGMRELFEKARAKGLWFYAKCQDIWCSPGELARHRRAGKFCWGAVNWELRDPAERISEYNAEILALVRERESFRARVAVTLSCDKEL